MLIFETYIVNFYGTKSNFFMETLEMIYLYVVQMDYAKSFGALHFTFNLVREGRVKSLGTRYRSKSL